MKLNELAEGWFSKKKTEPVKSEFEELTPADRALIKSFFPSTNVDTIFSSGKYVLPTHVNGTYGKGTLNFFKRDGTLTVAVGFHKSESDALDRKKSPLTHFSHPATKESLTKLKQTLS